MLAAQAAALSGCGSCKPLTTVEEARADLTREIHMRPRRFFLTGAPKHITMSQLPAPEMENQGGWFF